MSFYLIYIKVVSILVNGYPAHIKHHILNSVIMLLFGQNVIRTEPSGDFS